MSCDWGSCYFQGSRKPLADPIPGGSGEEGSVWTRVAPLVRAAGTVSDFAVTVLAQGGTSAAQWAPGGSCFKTLEAATPKIESCGQPVTHIVYHQGERDTFLGTNEADYLKSFEGLHDYLVSNWPGIPIYVCTVSHRMGATSEAVRRAQQHMQTTFAGCSAGPDTDKLGPELRRDNTHFSAAGLEEFAKEMAKIFV